MVGQVVQHHGVAGVNGVGPREELHTIFDGVWLLAVELQNSQAHEGSDALRVELQGSTKGQTGLLQFV